MRDAIYYFVMVPMVYGAAAIFISGLLFKLMVAVFSPGIKGKLGLYPRKLPFIAGVAKDAFLISSAFKKDKLLWFFVMAFHASFILLFLGHLELIRNFDFLQIIPHNVFLGSGVVGIVLIVATLYFLFRRFRSPWREISVPEDFLLLLTLFVAMLFGSHMHLAARYGIAGFDIPLEDYRAYLWGLVTLKPVLPDGITFSPHYIIVVLHVFFANLFIMLFPFSKMIHSVFAFFGQSLKRK
ncbi:MAG TPA: respiratory nitrate reductase subunit gamma [Spirochaetota bacterium]|nr:respiratory nitrate reductase subunit gamma [Spirochaetota bacterium]HPI90284.1 respiratory nitrate reductase subunit gamma [Spirochaetota bacterium]HPR46378.1 respiratory nitrate reductase subunit gamma [Spirochaetota bacterium]